MTAVQTMQHRASRRRARPKAMSEINVTPFVDVMLVLLIVFMVTAPLLTVGIAVDLPQTRARALGQDQEPLSVTIDRSGQVFLQNTAVSQEELVPKLTAIARNGYDQRIYVRADKTVPYGTVAQIMGLISSAGFTRIGLVNDSERRTPNGERRERER
jgi:biopolymer transport protein TolR